VKREDAIQLVKDLLSAAYRGDIPRLTQFYADDAVVVSPMFGEVRGADAIATTWRTLFTTAADFSAEISHILVDGDRIAVLSTISTIDRIGWFGLPPTGGPITYKLVLLFTVADGRVTRDERIYDSAGVIERLEKARLDKELRTAAEVQRTLLSQTMHTGRASHTVGDSVPCRAIGGDFFDFIDLPSGDVGIVMGDVAGKGPAAALLAAMVQGMFAMEAPSGAGPAATLTRINRHLVSRRLESRFATVFYGVLSPGGRFVYSNAGHNPPAILTGNSIRRLTTGGPILGAFDTADFNEGAIHLGDGDTLVLFTDGVTEARNRHDEEFGEDRLLDCLRAHHRATPDDLLQRVFDAVRTFCDGADPTDDITVTVTRFDAGLVGAYPLSKASSRA
jgi:serine phosphatase RsbU (regulator of sigma subunit)/limonene-1,2-epoxide hydrolase